MLPSTSNIKERSFKTAGGRVGVQKGSLGRAVRTRALAFKEEGESGYLSLT